MSINVTEQQLRGFLKVVNSLLLANRSELVDNRRPTVTDLFVDPALSRDSLTQLLLPETTLIVGSKGTGKSTLFQRLQHELNSSRDALSAYVDIPAVFNRARLD